MMYTLDLTKLQFQEKDLQPLIDIIRQKHGLDFNQYTRSSLLRRVNNAARGLNIPSKSRLMLLLGRDSKLLERFVNRIFVPVSSMFRDPEVFQFLRQMVLPSLIDEPHIKIWHAGCATGEEVYSMAILLREVGLLNKSTIYATDANEEAIDQAKMGIYLAKDMQVFTQNYHQAGGKQPFSSYYCANYGRAKINETLRENVVFARHDLVSDIPFSNLHIILCRNVLIYFEKKLQEKVLNQMQKCLYHEGFLCLGNKETLGFSGNYEAFKVVSAKHRIYQLSKK